MQKHNIAVMIPNDSVRAFIKATESVDVRLVANRQATGTLIEMTVSCLKILDQYVRGIAVGLCAVGSVK